MTPARIEKQFDQLIKDDPEYLKFVEELKVLSSSSFPDSGRGLLIIKQRCFDHMSIEYFFYYFKCMMAWAVTIGRCLDKYKSVQPDDLAGKWFKVPTTGRATDVEALLWKRRLWDFYIAVDEPEHLLYVTVRLSLRIKNNLGHMRFSTTNNELKFKLTVPKVNTNSSNEIDLKNPIDLMNSLMTIEVIKDKTIWLYSGSLWVHEFTPDKVAEIIGESKIYIFI